MSGLGLALIVSMSFSDVPMEDVIHFLTAQSGASIVLSAHDYPKAKDKPVTIEVSKIPTWQALKILARKLDRRRGEVYVGPSGFCISSKPVPGATRMVEPKEFRQKAKKKLDAMLRKKVSVSFDRAPLREIVSHLRGVEKGLNIVLLLERDEATRPVSVRLKDASIRHSLYVIAERAGCAVNYDVFPGIATVLPVLADDEFQLPPRPDNAALNYLLALSLLAQPRTAAKIKALKLVEDKVWKLPPEALRPVPEAVRLLERDLSKTGPLWAVHEGTQKKRCAFDVDWQAGPEALLPHLAQMRRLARRCVAAARCAEFKGDKVRAAEIYADVMQMGAHLGQDPIIISALVGVAVRSMATSGIEGLLARAAQEPGTQAAQALLSGLADVPVRAFRTDMYFRGEAAVFGGWLLRSAGKVVGDPKLGQQFAGMKADRLRVCVREYQDVMKRLAEAARGPYHESGPRLKAEKKRLEKTVAEMRRDPTKGNPLIPMLLPALWRCHDQFAADEARLGMLQLACAVVIYKQHEGKYPAKLDELTKHLLSDVPLDPFTGDSFLYKVRNGEPVIECGAPDELKKKRPKDFIIDLAARRKKDAQALKQFLQERK